MYASKHIDAASFAVSEWFIPGAVFKSSLYLPEKAVPKISIQNSTSEMLTIIIPRKNTNAAPSGQGALAPGPPRMGSGIRKYQPGPNPKSTAIQTMYMPAKNV